MAAYTTYQQALGLNREINTQGSFPSRGDQNGGTVATLGMIHTYGFSYSSGGAFANGAVLAPQSNYALFSLLGQIYGGDGANTFALPNLVGRVSVGWSYGGGATPIGADLGRASFSLVGANLPESSGGASASVSVAQPQLATTFVINAHGVYPGEALTYDTIGVVSEFAGNFAPNNSILCDGRLLSITDFPELFSVIGTAYGGNGVTTFAVPDLRGRTIVGVDADHPLGSVTGTDTTAITQANLPTNMGGQGTPVSLDGPEIALRQIVMTTGLYPVRGDYDSDTSIPFLGEIITFAGSVAVGGGSDAMGQTLSIAEHQELFTLFGTTYGGDGQTTFGIPDLGDHVVVGIGGTPGAGIPSISIGQQLGVDGITLSSADFGPLSINGTAGDDSRWGGDSNDTVNGAGGDDTLTGGRGDDRIDGGTGLDIASYADAAAGVTVTLGASGTAQNTGSAGIDTLVNIEKLIGSAFNDTLTTASVAAPSPLVITAGEHGSTGSAVMIDGSFVSGSIGTPHVTASVTGTSETYFRFTVTEAGTATFAVTNAVFDAQIELYNANGAFIGGSGFSSNHYYFARDLAVGTYYVSFGANASANSGSYTFDITVPGHSVLLTVASLDGGAGADVLLGGDGNDILDGGTGADRMTGGTGDDRYVVDRAGDSIVESLNSGHDSVESSRNYRLGTNLEDLVLTGNAVIGKGNALDNRIEGGERADSLSGLAGNDVLLGGGARDTLDGGGGRDLLIGGASRDVLTGGGGADSFIFSANDIGVNATQADLITDFSHNDRDRIDLSAIDADTAAEATSRFRFIGADAFTGAAGELRYEFSGGDTLVMGNTDSDTVANLVIRLTGEITLVAEDFVLISSAAQRISDFTGDLIDLSRIDGNSVKSGTQPLNFIGTAEFSGDPGELRYSYAGNTTSVAADLDGDKLQDFQLVLDGRVRLSGDSFVFAGAANNHMVNEAPFRWHGLSDLLHGHNVQLV